MLISKTSESSTTTTYQSREGQKETFYEITYFVPADWTDKSVQGDTVYYYPEDAMVMIMVSDVDPNTKLDYETAGQIVTGMSSEMDSLEVKSISSFDMNISDNAFKIDWTATHNQTDIRSVTVVFIYGSYFYSMHYCNFDNKLTPEFDEFEKIVKDVEIH